MIQLIEILMVGFSFIGLGVIFLFIFTTAPSKEDHIKGFNDMMKKRPPPQGITKRETK